MLPASTNGGGQCDAMVPDVCKTPSESGMTPIPYPNVGQASLAVSTSTKVKFSGRQVVHVMSEIPTSTGDEPGVGGGIVSGININKVTYQMGSTKVNIEGQPCEFQTAPTGHNGTSPNTGGIQTALSQINVLVAP